jgi:hypothetical protein
VNFAISCLMSVSPLSQLVARLANDCNRVPYGDPSRLSHVFSKNFLDKEHVPCMIQRIIHNTRVNDTNKCS